MYSIFKTINQLQQFAFLKTVKIVFDSSKKKTIRRLKQIVYKKNLIIIKHINIFY